VKTCRIFPEISNHDFLVWRGRVLLATLDKLFLSGEFPSLKSRGKVGKKLTNNFIILCELVANRASAHSHEVEALNDRQASSVFSLSTKRCANVSLN
jgi:hypothetical protein